MYLPLPPRDERNELDWGNNNWWKQVLTLVPDRSTPAYYQRFTCATLAVHEEGLVDEATRLGGGAVNRKSQRVHARLATSFAFG